MNTEVLLKTSPMGLPSEFVTPPASPNKRDRDFLTQNEPPPLKRKRTPSFDDGAFSLSRDTGSIPFLDCAKFGRDPAKDYLHRLRNNSASRATPLPNIILRPRQKKSRHSRLPSFPEELEPMVLNREDNSDLPLRRKRTRKLTIPSTRIKDNNDITSYAIASDPPANSLQATLSTDSSCTMPNISSLNMTRSLSLQVNMSLLNLAAAASSSSIASTNILPQRKSLLHVPSSSLQEESSSRSNETEEPPRRSRSPVATTLDYLATAMRFPDGAMGLSI